MNSPISLSSFVQFDTLLNLVIAVSKKYEHISNISGENFNVFKILKMQSSEVRLHSAFLGELLNPKGSHGQGDLFLKLFVEKFQFKNSSFNTEKATVEVEKHIGFLNEEKTIGGRLDLLITDNNRQQIIIENKIYAPDQSNQLVRYYNYNPKADLIYLCLFSGEVSKTSSGDLSLSDFKVISYEKDIVQWLLECRKEAVDHPILREGLTQYLNLIKYLTGQSINQAMNKELVELLTTNYERFDAAFTIANSLEDATVKLLDKLKELIREIANELDLECEVNLSFNIKNSGFYFWAKEWQSVKIGFQFQNYDKGLIYGLIRKNVSNELSESISSNIKEVFQLFLGKSSVLWPCYKEMDEPYENWTEKIKDPWLGIIDQSIKRVIKDKVNLIISHVQHLDTI